MESTTSLIINPLLEDEDSVKFGEDSPRLLGFKNSSDIFNSGKIQ